MIGKIISHYKIFEKLGKGGMGIVYKAEDTRLKRTVALEFLPPELTRDPEAEERFIQEARAASAIEHNNICTIYEINETKPAPGEPGDGQIFIAMACYEGETLREKISRGPLRIEEALDIASQVSNALQEAHEKGIVHRDLKPANVMITRKGQAKIMDFGLAKLRGQKKLTREGTTVGTVAYMSPEQARGEEVDHRTDIWSLGTVLYEMITAHIPFEGEYEQAVVYSILNEDPKPMTGLRTGISIELERIVSKTLEKNPNERYQHLDEVLVDLRAIARVPESRAITFSQTKAKRFRAKHTYIYAGIVILLLILLAGRFILFPGDMQQAEAIDSVAILPLENISGNPDQEYFAQGMTEALITELSKIKALRVISRTSAMRYKNTDKSLPQIANELSVDAVVEGSALLAGEHVRITAQLIEAATDRHIWADSYERELRDIITLQKEVAHTIAQEIRITVTKEEQGRLAQVRPVNPEAYELYLKGRYFWDKRTPEAMTKGIEYFRQAIREDPDYALAYTGLADSYHLLASYSILAPMEAFPKAKEAALKALEIDGTLAEAHNSLAATELLYDWDWAAAEREFKRAIELNPNYVTAHQWYAIYLTVTERMNEAITEIKRAMEIDPLSLSLQTGLARQFYFVREYDQAIEQYDKALELDANYVFARAFLGLAYVQKLMYEEAIAEFRQAVALTEGKEPGMLAVLGHAYGVSGQNDEALGILSELSRLSEQRYVPPFYIAVVYVGLGDSDHAFEWLEKACADRSEWMIYLNVEHILDPIREDPRFETLVERIGLTE